MTISNPAATLSERLTEAQQATEEPSRHVAELETALRAALDGHDYATAERLKQELADARMEHGIAAAAVTGLQSAIAEIDRQQAEDDRVIQEARQRAEARRVADEAAAAEQRELAALDEAVARFWDAVAAAQAAYMAAVAQESAVGAQRERAYRAQVVLGERPDGMRIVAPNPASVLRESDKLVRALEEWTGPERRPERPVTAAGGPGVPGRAQAAPW